MKDDPNGYQRSDLTVATMMDMEWSETGLRKEWLPWRYLGRVADIGDIHSVIWEKGSYEGKRSAWRLVKDKNVYVKAGEDWVTTLHAKVSWFTDMWTVILTGIGNDREDCGRTTLERCMWDQVVRSDSVTKMQHTADRWYSLRVPQYEYLFLVNYSPIWKCE